VEDLCDIDGCQFIFFDMTKTQKTTIFFLLVFTILSRFVSLNRVPPHLSNDEISIAYDAYSILHTGRDEHNNFLPVSFQSHGTYKAPFYVYIASISNYFWGNSEISVRLPSAILGSLTVLVLGYLIFLLSRNINLAILSAGVLAFAPWHIYCSRMALESNVALFLLTLAILLFFRMLQTKKNRYLFFSVIFFALSMWGYHSEWLLTPMIMIGLLVFYRRKIRLNLFWGASVFLFLVFIFPIAKDAWQNRDTTARANTEVIINDPGVAKIINDEKKSLIEKTMVVGKSFGANYSNYTKLGHLFFDGLPILPKEDAYCVGLFLLPLLPFFLWGLFKIKRYFPKDYLFVYFWIIVGPIVPSLTIGGANMVRNLVTVVPYSLLMAVGIYDLRFCIKGFRLILFCFLVLISFFYFLVMYYYHFPFQMGENFQYGYKQAAEYIENNYSKYDRIVVDPRFGEVNIYRGVPHLYLAYFTKLEPEKMLERKNTEKGLSFDKYEIGSINWNVEKIEPRTLYLVPFDNQPSDTVGNLRTVEEIRLPSYKVEFKLLESF